MIQAVFYMYSDKTYRGFSVSGHAGYENAGKDIICASVSALVINTVNAVDALTENVCACEQDSSGSIKFKFSSDSDEQVPWIWGFPISRRNTERSICKYTTRRCNDYVKNGFTVLCS